jgi:hypothetical protein
MSHTANTECPATPGSWYAGRPEKLWRRLTTKPFWRGSIPERLEVLRPCQYLPSQCPDLKGMFNVRVMAGERDLDIDWDELLSDD